MKRSVKLSSKTSIPKSDSNLHKLRNTTIVPAFLIRFSSFYRQKQDFYISEPVVQVAISSMLRYKNHRAAAAGIAGLVGNCSISEAGFVGEVGKITTAQLIIVKIEIINI